MHYFGNPRHSQTVIAYDFYWVFLEIPVKKCIVGMLFRFPAKSTLAIYLSLSAKYIAAAADRDNKIIQLYNRATKSVTIKALPGHTYQYNHHFLPDGGLLVTGWGGELIKYRIPEAEDKQLDIVWTCEGLDFPNGVSSDERGLIYAAGSENKTIYIINDEGLRQKNHCGDDNY